MPSQPIKTYRLTWDELMTHRSEIAPGAVLEVRVYPPDTTRRVDAENQALIDLLRSWRKEDDTDDQQELVRRDAETRDLMTRLEIDRIALRDVEV